MKRVAKKSGFVFIYLCTHVVTVWGGENKRTKFDRKETGYFCMADTAWKDARTVAATSIAVSNFTQLLNDIPCERKAIAIHYAHQVSL